MVQAEDGATPKRTVPEGHTPTGCASDEIASDEAAPEGLLPDAVTVKELAERSPRHQHPEYELLLLLNARADCFINGCIGSLEQGDLLFLGPDLPHFYQCSAPPGGQAPGELAPGNQAAPTGDQEQQAARGLEIHFVSDAVPAGLFNRPEGRAIRKLLGRCTQGIRFPAAGNVKIHDLLPELSHLKGFALWLKLMELLQLLSQRDDYQLFQKNNQAAERDQERLSKVMEFAYTHFREDIRMEQAAELAGMAPASFSRYFKSQTGKKFSTFLLELKTGYAARLLQGSQESIADICYKSGFNNLSNFNRQFKSIYGLQPLQYRKKQQAEKEKS